MEFVGRALEDGPAPLLPPGAVRDHVGVRRQKDGRNYVGFALRSGRTSGSELTEIAELAARYGSGQVALSVEQKAVIRDVADADVEPLVAELEARDLRARPSVFRRGTMACTGIEFCKLAIVETKVRSVELYEELERRLPDFDTPLTINLNGCPNSCARFQTADIGLKGSIVDDDEGFQVHLGGSIGYDAAFGRKLRGLKVTSAGLPDYVERVLRNYTAGRAEGESFATWVRRADESLIS
jgi:sulfite reductase (ferredoxin)